MEKTETVRVAKSMRFQRPKTVFFSHFVKKKLFLTKEFLGPRIRLILEYDRHSAVVGNLIPSFWFQFRKSFRFFKRKQLWPRLFWVQQYFYSDSLWHFLRLLRNASQTLNWTELPLKESARYGTCADQGCQISKHPCRELATPCSENDTFWEKKSRASNFVEPIILILRWEKIFTPLLSIQADTNKVFRLNGKQPLRPGDAANFEVTCDLTCLNKSLVLLIAACLFSSPVGKCSVCFLC